MGEPQVVIETRHAAKRYRLSGTVTMTAPPAGLVGLVGLVGLAGLAG